MARVREFDVEDATERAMRLFWKQGYAGTSVRELCAAMGINSGSFYAAFGGKSGCFRAALARYECTQPVPRVPGEAAVAQWFEVVCDPERTPRGCLMVMSAVEAPMLDRESRAAVQGLLAAVRGFFERCLADRGEEAARADAGLLGAAVTAIHVMARAGAEPRALWAVAERAMAAVGIARSSSRVASGTPAPRRSRGGRGSRSDGGSGRSARR